MVNDDGTVGKSAVRTSSTAFLPREDPVVRAVMTRAAQFQGFVPTEHMEDLQVTQYEVGQQYMPHHDTIRAVISPSNSTDGNGGQGKKEDGGDEEQKDVKEGGRAKAQRHNAATTGRETTFFAILDDGCAGNCGTQFPLLTVNWTRQDGRWCELVECSERKLTIRARAGNAVFWRNIKSVNADGGFEMDRLTLHAGLPVTAGTKTGLNIWTHNGRFRTQDDEWHHAGNYASHF